MSTGQFRHAIVRPPASSFADGLTTAGLGAPSRALALAQHAGYCAALESCGLTVTRLPEDPAHPDSTFVEDTALITPSCAVLTRPGAPSRASETAAMRGVLASLGRELTEIQAPGTLDGGDVCETDGRFLIGISERTNAEGARQLAEILARHGFTAEAVDVRAIPGLLHLKTGLSFLGRGTVLASPALASHPALSRYRALPVAPGEEYGANAVLVNGRVLVPSGYPRLMSTLGAEGFDVLPVEMSEFQKMDGGLSCLSLRY